MALAPWRDRSWPRCRVMFRCSSTRRAVVRLSRTTGISSARPRPRRSRRGCSMSTSGWRCTRTACRRPREGCRTASPSRTRATFATCSAPTSMCALSWRPTPTWSTSTTTACVPRGGCLRRGPAGDGRRPAGTQDGGYPAQNCTGRRQRQPRMHAAPDDLWFFASEELPLWGAVMDMAFPGGVATLVSLEDGTTSLYTSTGGGVIGGGAHESVVEATHAFLDAVAVYAPQFSPIDTDDLPESGHVRFHALCFDGRRGADVEESDLQART